MWTNVALVLGAYLLGSLPHLAALGKFRGVKLEGDSHISLWNRGGRLVGTIGILGEFAKGIIPVLIGKSLDFDLSIVVVAGLVVVCGQMWPIFSRFDGEKGNSVGLAMAGTLSPLVVFIALVPIVIGVTIRTVPRLMNTSQPIIERLAGGPPSRSLPVAMAIGFLVMPIASWCLGKPPEITFGCLVLFILIMIRRLTAGLRSDLAVNTDIKGILINRLLYDRSYHQVAEISDLG